MPLNLKRLWAVLLCILLVVMLFDNILAQEQQQQRSRERRRPSWVGPELGTVIKDFELPVLGGGTFKLSEHKDKIVVIELGACT